MVTALLYFTAFAIIASVGALLTDRPWRDKKRTTTMDDFVDMLEEALPEDWSVYDPEMGESCLLECPHGHVIEQDGRCPEGCVSPMITMGWI